MKTLLSIHKPPFLHIITNTKPPPTSLNPTKIKIWILHSKPKGFSGTSETSSSNLKKLPDKKGANTERKEEEQEDEIPKVVFDRMATRVTLSVVVPMTIGLGFLALFGTLKEQQLWSVPKWLPVVTTFLTFGSSALGIAYGTLSTSWDPDDKGSVLGVEQVKENWIEMWKEDQQEKNDTF